MALEMLLIASSLPLIAVCISSRTRCNLLSDLLLLRHQVCCRDHNCWLLRCATAAAAADLEGLQPAPPAMALISGPLPCEMELCFGTRLEPTLMGWKIDQVRTTVL